MLDRSPFYIGVVEDRNDPLGAGRVRVRCVHLHIHDKTILPTKDLPWAMVMQPASAGGSVSVGPTEGTTVMVMFNDYPDNQYPIVVGALYGVPQGEPVNVDKFEDPPLWSDGITPQGRPMPSNGLGVNGNHVGPIEPGTMSTGIGGGTPGAPGGGIGELLSGVSSSGGVPGMGISNNPTSGLGAPSLSGIGSAGMTNVLMAPPALASLTQAGATVGGATNQGFFQSLVQPGAQSLGAVGGMLSSINMLGSTANIARNQFEGLIGRFGNVDQAISEFTMIATQSGPLGNALAAIFNGKASLGMLANDYGLGLSGIQSSLAGIKNATSIMGALQNAEALTGQLGSLLQNGSSVADSIIQGFNGASIGSTLSSIGSSATGVLNQVGGELAGTLSAGTSAFQGIADGLGLGNITGGIQGMLGGLGNLGGSLGGLFGGGGGGAQVFGEYEQKGSADSGSPLEKPQVVSAVLGTGLYSGQDALKENAGNFGVLQETPPTAITSEQFKDISEGATPPVNGCFGGPNFGGASPTLTPPAPADPTRYDPSTGSQNALNVTPPPGFDNPKVQQGIQALLAACGRHGLTTKEQQASLLGIVGGECGWVPQEESCQYSNPDRLCQIFKSTFKGKPQLAQQYANWTRGKKGPKSQFFNFVYDPSNNGRQLGNTQPGDGGKYFGRGFIQITGRSNYARYSQLSGHDILNNPDLANDPTVAADIAVLYLMDRVKGVSPTAHPGYFLAAKESVGNNSADIAARKRQYYEHFYGTLVPGSYGETARIAGPALPPTSYQGSMGGNESGQPNPNGYRDPNGKYPLPRDRYRPQVPKLARGDVSDTIVLTKEAHRTRGVPIAMDGGTWDQPNVPYGASYPYNHVRETESGHVQEFDDTPNYERIHTYHRSGTFEEIDANGTLVRKIVGDGYYILERNGFITVAGDCNLTVAGNVNIYCRSDANIEVAGSAEMKVGGNFDIGVNGDMNIAVERDFNVWANGSARVQAATNAHFLATGNMHLSATGSTHLYSNGDLYLQSLANIYQRANTGMFIECGTELNVWAHTDLKLMADADVNLKSKGELKLASKGKASVKSAAALALEAAGTASMKSSSVAAIDGAALHLNSGKSGSASDASDAAESADGTKALIHGMVPPPPGTPLYASIDRLAAPPLHGEENVMYESNPNGGGSPAGEQYLRSVTQNEGRSSTYESVSEPAGGGGGGGVVTPANQSATLATTEFNANYRLSRNFTLGMMFDGGFNARHRLVAQNGLSVQQIVANLSMLCENILEKYLQVLPGGMAGYGKQWVITSGYRMGTSNSDHNRGRAVDLSLLGAGGTDRKERHHELVLQLDKIVSYDQLILEYRGPSTSWIHTGFRTGTFGAAPNNRNMGFTMVNDATYRMGAFVLVT